ncbi:hypothetical protein B0T19DRAFT_487878 [Cercophora scortea]|uniref:Uncharacterized protein n=1 Tax=Cercophora scortea TaxID=314031 RepID=A0AAE0I762_9PEZI|nr:hypothetical protein B0T19DRAFT_487878 [Cercophora scortea]
MRAALLLVSALAAVVAGNSVSLLASTTSSSSESLVTSTSTSSSTSSIISSTSISSTSTSISVSTSEAPSTTTSESSTSLVSSSTTSSAPAAITTITGFCLKVVTPDVKNTGYHIGVVRVNTNIQVYPSNQVNVGRFNLDTTTGSLTSNETSLAGFGVYTPGPFENQVLRSLRVLAPPVAGTSVPVLCANPEGKYEDGSVLKCSITAQWSTGPRTYSRFITSDGAITLAGGTFALGLDGYTATNFWYYDVAIFWGDHCAP